MLYARELHEPLTDDTVGRGARARTRSSAIVAAAERAYRPEALLARARVGRVSGCAADEEPLRRRRRRRWGLEPAARSGHAETALDLRAVVAARARRASAPSRTMSRVTALPTPKRSSLFTGEAGLVLVAWLLEPNDELAAELLELVRENIGNASNELMWGVPGTLLAARALHARTARRRWRARGRGERSTRSATSATTTASGRRGSTGTRGAAPRADPRLRRQRRRTRRRARCRRDPPRARDRRGRPRELAAAVGSRSCRACSGATARPASSRPRATYLDEDLLLAGAELDLGRRAGCGRGERRRPLPRHGRATATRS